MAAPDEWRLMDEKKHTQLNLFLLLSLLLVILLYPVLDRGDFRHLILGILLFAPTILATASLAGKKHWMWTGVLLSSAIFVLTLAGWRWPTRLVLGSKWGLFVLFFGLAVAGLFSYLKNARSIGSPQLYTAASIYLLLGMQWFALYMAMDSIYPGSFLRNNVAIAERQSELLYFSLVTLSTIGYGDVVPAQVEVRMLAAMEGVTGVLYIAISVALLVSAFRRQAGTH